jgi:DNA invertase Pin-like site-specific DNA recombinase
MMIAAIYARKSTEQNGISDDAKSVTRQIEHARAYATTKGWRVSGAHVFVDDGISGAEFATRPGFQRLMAAVETKPPFQVLVMSEESRLGREAIETGYAIKRLLQAGVRIFVYLEDREIKLGTFADNVIAYLRGETSAEERRKGSQRTYDAMQRLARAGHVTGGACFGYVNLDVTTGQVDQHGRPVRSHVERRVHPGQAAIVRRIFELAARGSGLTRIAKHLNAERAAWVGSSVRSVLYRESYRGRIVWNQTKRRDAWGQGRRADRPAAEWVHVDAPDLRIVSDDLWTAAHQRLGERRDQYLAATKGHRHGRPIDTDSKYLPVGFARCGECGAGLHVRTVRHGTRRVTFYACTGYWLRGVTVCRNHTLARMDLMDAAVLEAFNEDVLQPEVIDRTIARALALLGSDAVAAERARLEGERATAEAECARLADAIARGQPSISISSGARCGRRWHAGGTVCRRAIPRRRAISSGCCCRTRCA